MATPEEVSVHVISRIRLQSPLNEDETRHIVHVKRCTNHESLAECSQYLLLIK